MSEERQLFVDDRIDQARSKLEALANRLYPVGTFIETRLRDNWPYRVYRVRKVDQRGDIHVESVRTGAHFRFYPHLYPHRKVRGGV